MVTRCGGCWCGCHCWQSARWFASEVLASVTVSIVPPRFVIVVVAVLVVNDDSLSDFVGFNQKRQYAKRAVAGRCDI